MSNILGLELHTRGVSVAAVDAAGTLRPLGLPELDGSFAQAAARQWKWSLGTDDGDLLAVVTAGQLFADLERCVGLGTRAVVAIPSAWGDRPRRSLVAAFERTTFDVLRFTRATSALLVGASLADDALSGVCAVVDLGGHKLEVALAEVTDGMLRVLARASRVDLDDERVGFGELLPIIESLGRRLTDDAGLASRDIERVITTGRRLALPSVAHGVEAIWGRPPEVVEAGTIARGAARIGAGLAGVLAPWLLDDDLDEEPLSRLRPVTRRSTPIIPPVASTRSSLPPRPSSLPPEPSRPSSLPPEPSRPSSLPPEPSRPSSMPPPPAPPRPETLLPPPSSTPSSLPPPSERPSDADLGERPSVIPSAGPIAPVPDAGEFDGLASIDSVRALHLAHPVATDGLARPALLTLLSQFMYLRGLSGTLTLRSRDDVVALPIHRGGVCVSLAERPRALRIAEWPGGSFTWREEPLAPTVAKHRGSMTAFVVGALRVRLRAFDERDLAAAYDAKMALSPSVIGERRPRLERLALPETEERAIAHVVDGSRPLSTMLGEGYIGRGTMLRLVVLLDAYEVLQWSAPTHDDAEDPVEAMARTLTAMTRGNHFVALGVHWSAAPEEVRAAWERLRAAYGADGSLAAHDPATAAAIVARADAAWAVLRDDASRVRYRREAYAGMDEALLAPLVEARAKALEMRGETRAAAEMTRLQKEFAAVLPRRDPKQ